MTAHGPLLSATAPPTSISTSPGTDAAVITSAASDAPCAVAAHPRPKV
jgi:hypothetical protein